MNNQQESLHNNQEYITDKNLAEKLIKELNLEEAKNLLEDLTKKYSSSAEIFDLYSEVLMSLNKIKEAKKAIEVSINLDPLSSGDKYMTLGQLFDEPKKKLQSFVKGIEVYKHKLDNISKNSNNNINNDPTVNKDIENSESELHIKYALSSALSSIAELYMTTYLCDEPNAEATCEGVLKEAHFYFEDNADMLIQYSNLRILRGKDKEALDYMEKAYNIILNSKTTEFFPDCDTISNLAKNYSELKNFYQATKLLDIIVKMDENNYEYWYLLAFNHFQMKNYYHCLTCVERIRESMNKTGDIDFEISEATKELEGELVKIKNTEGELKNNIFEEGEENGKEECISNGNSMMLDD